MGEFDLDPRVEAAVGFGWAAHFGSADAAGARGLALLDHTDSCDTCGNPCTATCNTNTGTCLTNCDTCPGATVCGTCAPPGAGGC
ncbi:hypothetical protein [Fodinicola acaciae]|uniref:hypothetical protein n=1 Tax=Fodinicola acaciae TaxID=2681555 RepID=UPI0013CF5DD0|nr:hypothetical protein [Fodinicola acaciae]